MEYSQPLGSNHSNDNQGVSERGSVADMEVNDSHSLMASSTGSTASALLSSQSESFNISDILMNGVVVMPQPPTDVASLVLPERFWSEAMSVRDIPLDLMNIIDRDLSYW